MKFLPALVAFCCGISLYAQPPMRLSGSTTVKGALEPKRAALESSIGRPIDFAGTGPNAGVISLINGSADVAMLSVPLEEVARVVNQKTPGRVDVSKFRANYVGEMKKVFIVNPRNPVRSLSSSQLVDILLGRIASWKEVGGDDAPIVVVMLANSGPLIQDQLLGGRLITSSARAVPVAAHIPAVVAQEPNAIGIVSTVHERGETNVLETDVTVVASLFLVTIGEPSPAVNRLIVAAREALAEPVASTHTTGLPGG